MLHVLVWLLALLVGLIPTYVLTDEHEIWGLVTAWALVVGIWQITRLYFVAGARRVAKMSTARTTQHLHLMVRRMLLTLVGAGVIYLMVRPRWGMAYWLGIAGFYQVGLGLMIRDLVRDQPLQTVSTTEPPPPTDNG
jgi:hypothetical protein